MNNILNAGEALKIAVENNAIITKVDREVEIQDCWKNIYNAIKVGKLCTECHGVRGYVMNDSSVRYFQAQGYMVTKHKVTLPDFNYDKRADPMNYAGNFKKRFETRVSWAPINDKV